MSDQPVLKLENIVRSFDDLVILDGANLEVQRGEMIALLGPSGSGKSSLLHVAGLLEPPTGGRVYIDGEDVSDVNDKTRTALRRDRIGFVYQFHHLLPEFNAEANVSFPQRIAGVPPGKAAERSRELLTGLGLAERMDHQPAQLSGGEKQRVAIARALANRPSLLLADEPTGNLDVETSRKVFDALMSIVRGEGLAAIIATHDQGLASHMDRVVTIKDRKLVPGLLEVSTV
ncbi:ABC transporter ATP-binding protein [Parvularcula marina]|uniref:ABC transporter ATP-binding protein n=1 Tax=Parvularcula marina TaxID=2292771 RepID=UPI0035131E7C